MGGVEGSQSIISFYDPAGKFCGSRVPQNNFCDHTSFYLGMPILVPVYKQRKEVKLKILLYCFASNMMMYGILTK